MNFWDSRAGYKFAEHTVPQLIKAINRLADQIEKANVAQDKMLAKILQFAEAESFEVSVSLKQLKALWSAYCIAQDYEPDTAAYDSHLKQIWSVLKKNPSNPFRDYVSFDSYMCMDLV